MIIVKPTRIHSVTSTTEAKAQPPLDCQGRPAPPSSEFRTPMVSLKKKVPMTPTATPEMTSGR